MGGKDGAAESAAVQPHRAAEAAGGGFWVLCPASKISHKQHGGGWESRQGSRAGATELRCPRLRLAGSPQCSCGASKHCRHRRAGAHWERLHPPTSSACMHEPSMQRTLTTSFPLPLLPRCRHQDQQRATPQREAEPAAPELPVQHAAGRQRGSSQEVAGRAAHPVAQECLAGRPYCQCHW